MAKILNDEEIVRVLWKHLSKSQRDPYDDDVSWITNQTNKKLVITKSDMLVQSTDVPRGMGLDLAASKSVVSCVSDFAAKGVRPEYCVVSLGIPRKYATTERISDLAIGFARVSKEYGVMVIAGDTNATSSDLVIDCSMFGFSEGVVKRRNAQPGDAIGVSGLFGLQSSGLLMLLGKAKTKDREFARKAKDTVLRPKARLDFGVRSSRYLRSCIDSSDGLALSLYHLAEASRVDIELEDIPTAQGVQTFARENGLDFKNLVLFGGEEYELIFTFDKRHTDALKKLGARIIGRVLSRSEKPSVFLDSRKVERKGWIHFA